VTNTEQNRFLACDWLHSAFEAISELEQNAENYLADFLAH
jgi:hypothetical protein